MATTRATEKAVARALAEACDVFGIPCMFNADGSVKPNAWQTVEAVRDDVTREGRMHGAQGFHRNASGELSFFGYAPGSSGHASVHPVLVAIGIPRDSWHRGLTTREALDRLTVAARSARMAIDEMTDDDYAAM